MARLGPGVAVVVVVAAVALAPPAGASRSAPTLAQVDARVQGAVNARDHSLARAGESTECAYTPARVARGYRFDCFTVEKGHVVGAFASVTTTGPAASSPTFGVRVTTKGSSSLVGYLVSATGGATTGNVSYWDGTGNVARNGAPLPFAIVVTSTTLLEVYASILTSHVKATVTCQILRVGQRTIVHSTTGPYASVDCLAS